MTEYYRRGLCICTYGDHFCVRVAFHSGMGFNMGEDCCERVGCDWASPFESAVSQQKVRTSLYSIIIMSVYWTVCSPFRLSGDPPIWLCICLSVYLPVRLIFCHSSVCMPDSSPITNYQSWILHADVTKSYPIQCNPIDCMSDHWSATIPIPPRHLVLSN